MENDQMNEQPEKAKPSEKEASQAPEESIIHEPAPAIPTGAAESGERKDKSFWQKSLGWAAAVLASLIAGFAICFFLLYWPANTSLRQSRSDLMGANNALELAQTKADGLQTNLTDANSKLESVNADLESANLRLAVSALQSNISFARLALANKDILTARQELADAEANLAILTQNLDDSDTTSALADRLKTIRANLTSDPSKALEEMRIMGENLARLDTR